MKPYSSIVLAKFKVLFDLPLDTGVNKWSRGSRNAQVVVLFNSPTYNISNDTPYAYIKGQIKIHVFAIFLRFWALLTCATFRISTFEVSYATFPMSESTPVATQPLDLFWGFKLSFAKLNFERWNFWK